MFYPAPLARDPALKGWGAERGTKGCTPGVGSRERGGWSEQTNERTVRTTRKTINLIKERLHKLYFVTFDFVTLRRFDIEEGR